MTECKLTPQGINLKAMLAAYDRAQEGMLEQEKKAMNKKVVSGEQQFSISAEKAEKKRAAVRIGELQGKSVIAAEQEVQALKEAAEMLNAPGIQNLLKMLGADETKHQR